MDHLTTEAGSTAGSYRYDAFGNALESPQADTSRYRFSTKEFDARSGLYYFGARYYDPEVGRWLTPDPAGFVDGLNLYAYVNNNPVNMIDPDGAQLMPMQQVFGGPFIMPVTAGPVITTSILPQGSMLLTKNSGMEQKGGEGDKKSSVVIGEGMERVKEFARNIGAKWYQAWRKYFEKESFDLDQSLKRQERWIKKQIKEGKTIYDIGPEGKGIESQFYQAERDAIDIENYPTIKLY